MGKRILVLGYFGYDTNQLDGQTIKTRTIYETLKKQKEIGAIKYYDTQHLKKNPFSFFFMCFNLFWCNRLIIIPGVNNLKVIFPFTYYLSFVSRYEIIHVAVAGGHVGFFKTYKLLGNIAKKVKINLFQNRGVANDLRTELGFTNTEWIPNYRIQDFKPTFMENDVFKLVFMARIHRLKGLDVVFSIAEYLKEKYGESKFLIDFYGPINNEDHDYFMSNIEKFNFVHYHGELEPVEINETLNKYDLLLLPTRYYTEGFPGSILDAYISGIPVLVSNWKHAHEFVNDGINGYICELDDLEQFYDRIDMLYNDRELLLQLKKNAYLTSKKYSEEHALKIIKNYL